MTVFGGSMTATEEGGVGGRGFCASVITGGF